MKNFYYIIVLVVLFYSCNEVSNSSNQNEIVNIDANVLENDSENVQKCEAPWCTVGFTVYNEDGTPWFEVALEDFTRTTTMKEAKQICEKLGNGWRLPTDVELAEMHHQLYEKNKGNFGGTGIGLYCSSIESEKEFPVFINHVIDHYEKKVYCYYIVNDQDFYFGQYTMDNEAFSLRPVRSL